ALNPCSCGNKGIAGKNCRCSPADVRRYEKRISGPIIDRIDMWIEVSRIEHDKLMRKRNGSNETDRARELVDRARRAQATRFAAADISATSNSNISARDLSRVAALSSSAQETL